MIGLIIAIGFIAVGAGSASAKHTFRVAHRSYYRTNSLVTTISDGWESWFLGAFSGLTMGIRWCAAIAVWIILTASGLGLIGLGIQLLYQSLT